MKIQNAPLAGLGVVESTRHKDTRGSFARFYCENELADIIGTRKIVQINHSITAKIGAVRGLHFQFPPHAEMKLIRCIKGKVWDLALDIRSGSPTFLKWHGEELSASNDRMIVIPEGFAHGFQVLESDSELLYLHTACYSPDHEGGLRQDDPNFSIRWPLAVTDLSGRDLTHPLIDSAFAGITP